MMNILIKRSNKQTSTKNELTDNKGVSYQSNERK